MLVELLRGPFLQGVPCTAVVKKKMTTLAGAVKYLFGLEVLSRGEVSSLPLLAGCPLRCRLNGGNRIVLNSAARLTSPLQNKIPTSSKRSTLLRELDLPTLERGSESPRPFPSGALPSGALLKECRRTGPTAADTDDTPLPTEVAALLPAETTSAAAFSPSVWGSFIEGGNMEPLSRAPATSTMRRPLSTYTTEGRTVRRVGGGAVGEAAHLGKVGQDDTTAEVGEDVAHKEPPAGQTNVDPRFKGELFESNQGSTIQRGGWWLRGGRRRGALQAHRPSNGARQPAGRLGARPRLRWLRAGLAIGSRNGGSERLVLLGLTLLGTPTGRRLRLGFGVGGRGGSRYHVTLPPLYSRLWLRPRSKGGLIQMVGAWYDTQVYQASLDRGVSAAKWTGRRT